METRPRDERDTVTEVLAETTTPAEPETPVEPETPETPVEPETPETPADPETPDEQPAPAGPNEQEMEAILQKIDRSATTFRNRVSDLLGEQAQDLSPCPLCSDGIMGHLFPVEWITPVSEVQARLLEVLKTPSAPDYRAAPNVRRCGTCDGWGRVVSGSRVAGKESVVCVTCKGYGFQGDAGAAASAGNGVVVDFPPELPDETPVASGDTDIWGSPRLLPDGQENPNYGKMPQYKNPALP